MLCAHVPHDFVSEIALQFCWKWVPGSDVAEEVGPRGPDCEVSGSGSGRGEEGMVVGEEVRGGGFSGGGRRES